MSKTELQAISVQSEPHFKYCWFRFWRYERSGVHDICSVHISIITVFIIDRDSMFSLKSCIHFLNTGNKCSYFYNLYSTCFTSVKKKKKSFTTRRSFGDGIHFVFIIHWKIQNAQKAFLILEKSKYSLQ